MSANLEGALTRSYTSYVFVELVLILVLLALRLYWGRTRLVDLLLLVLNGIIGWAGTMAFTPDGLPRVGPLPSAPGISVITGMNGHGMGWAPALAETLRSWDGGRLAINIIVYVMTH